MDNTRLESSELTVELCGHRSPQLSIFSYFCIAYSDTMVSAQLLDEGFCCVIWALFNPVAMAEFGQCTVWL